ncbi:MAG: nitrogen regulation protein NR(I) [Arenimonas sp.]|nr:nitrogen regulation protein NR(I) [Arenimonas sp.]
MHAPEIWLIDDDASIRFVLSEALGDQGYAVRSFDASQSALQALSEGDYPALMFTDIRMPGGSGLDFLEKVKQSHPQLPIIVMSAFTDISNTASAFRGGAIEYIAKPFDLDELLNIVAKALPKMAPSEQQTNEDPPEFASTLLGKSPVMRELFKQIGRMAQLPLTVLITGETGTGKELVARALHQESPRSAKPFIALNTAAIPNELLESELFGHESGAFTGATQQRIGRFEQAQGGTLFLDEIGDMPLALQTRLLRVLAEGEFYRVGGRALIKVDVRVIAATHQPLEELVHSKRFRADLLHRLNVLRIRLPALRERKQDVGLLAEHFCLQATHQLQVQPKVLSKELKAAMSAYHWPGNVRELENACWRMVSSTSHQQLEIADWQEHPSTISVASASWQEQLTQLALNQLQQGQQLIHAPLKHVFEQCLLDAALQFTDGHRQQAAQLLGLGRNTVSRKLSQGQKQKAQP